MEISKLSQANQAHLNKASVDTTRMPEAPKEKKGGKKKVIAALAGLAALMGHRAATICTIIAQRVAKNACTDYKPFVRRMIEMALDKLAAL